MTDEHRGLSFDDYVAAHGRALESYAYVLTGQAATAQDLVQTALMKAYRHWRKVSRLEFPDAYVRRILTNAFLDLRRRKGGAEQFMADLPDRASGSDLADAAAVRGEIAWALGFLTPHQRAAIVLRHYLGQDDAAIADAMGCSPSTVRSHISRGLSGMREVLGGRAETQAAPIEPGHQPSTNPPRIRRMR